MANEQSTTQKPTHETVVVMNRLAEASDCWDLADGDDIRTAFASMPETLRAWTAETVYVSAWAAEVPGLLDQVRARQASFPNATLTVMPIEEIRDVLVRQRVDAALRELDAVDPLDLTDDGETIASTPETVALQNPNMGLPEVSELNSVAAVLEAFAPQFENIQRTLHGIAQEAGCDVARAVGAAIAHAVGEAVASLGEGQEPVDTERTEELRAAEERGFERARSLAIRITENTKNRFCGRFSTVIDDALTCSMQAIADMKMEG